MKELFLDFDEKAEWDSAPKGGRCNNKIGQAAGGRISVGMIRRRVGDVVDEVLVVLVC